MRILSIETSCDETAIALVEGEEKPSVVFNLVSSQIELHKITQGIVPEVAARAQLEAILPMISEAKKLGASAQNIDAIAVTYAPGLVGSLIVGVEGAKTLGALWQKPVYGIHHLEGHIYAAFAQMKSKEIHFPVLALVVSGGHTELVLMKKHFHYEIIGSTRDDAAGEAFDKIARLIGLGYPGGPAISQAALKHKETKKSAQLNLPRPMLTDKSLDFSFSGLKTAVLYKVPEEGLNPAQVHEYAHETERAIIDVLVGKTRQALHKNFVSTLILAGGVSANKLLRREIKKLRSEFPIEVIIPPFDYTTDNAAMIGLAAWHRLALAELPSADFKVMPRLKLSDINKS